MEDKAQVQCRENGRWEWLMPANQYFLEAADGSICTFETEEEAREDRRRHLAAPRDDYGLRMRSKEEVLHLLRTAAVNESDCDASALDVNWQPRNGVGHNWYVHTHECTDDIWDVITLLQATYSIPDEASSPT